MKKLSLKDRLTLLVRCIKLVAMSDNKHITLLWQKSECGICTHTFYVDGDNPTDALMLYFSYVAAKSDNIEQLNTRTAYFLNKIAVGYCLQHKIDTDSIQYYPYPFIEKEK